VLGVLRQEHLQKNLAVCEGAFGVLWNISTNNGTEREPLMHVGRETIVCVPSHAPSCAPSSAPPRLVYPLAHN
jgi:hypothetical protein